MTSDSSRALITSVASHTRPPTRHLRPPGTWAGIQVHIPVPPAIMPTDFTVLMTGSDFLSGRMANFPGESRRGEVQLSNRPCLGVRRAGTLPASQGIPLQCSEQTQKTKSQSWPGSQNENPALWDLPLKARSQGSARPWHPEDRAHLPHTISVPCSVLWSAGSRSSAPGKAVPFIVTVPG